MRAGIRESSLVSPLDPVQVSDSLQANASTISMTSSGRGLQPVAIKSIAYLHLHRVARRGRPARNPFIVAAPVEQLWEPELLFETHQSMMIGQEMAAGADAVDGVYGQVFVIHDDAARNVFAQADNLVGIACLLALSLPGLGHKGQQHCAPRAPNAGPAPGLPWTPSGSSDGWIH